MPQKYKNELEDYMNTLKGVNKIQDIRIAALQRSKPLIKAEINDWQTNNINLLYKKYILSIFKDIH